MQLRFEKGDRVRDKYKLPKPGGEAVEGVVEKVGDIIEVRMDDGELRAVPHSTFVALFARVD